jgi:hypothetical protein
LTSTAVQALEAKKTQVIGRRAVPAYSTETLQIIAPMKKPETDR